MNIGKSIARFGKDTVDMWKYHGRYFKRNWPILVGGSVLLVGAEIGIEYAMIQHSKKEYEKTKKEFERQANKYHESEEVEVNTEVE